jgi:hypothetical protein
MIDKLILHAIRLAFALSEEQARPFFVYRPALPRPAPVVTFDEAQAAALCDDAGYTCCDATEEVNDDLAGRQ